MVIGRSQIWRSLLLVVVLLLGWPERVSLAEDSSDAVSLHLEVSPRSGTTADSFSLSVVVDGLGGGAFPLLEGGDDFKLTLLGSQVEMVGSPHEQRFRMIYRYRLLPKKPGTLITPGAELTIGSRTLRAAGVEVQVTEPQVPLGHRTDEVFLLQSIDKQKLYVGEQTWVALELYASRELYRPQFLNLAFDDFWTVPLKEDDPFERKLDDIAYRVQRIRRALYPLVSGKLVLPSRQVKTGVITLRRTKLPAFGGFFSFESVERTSEDRTVASNEVPLEILPLPPSDSPLRLWGSRVAVVGTTLMSGSLDRIALKTGETALLSIELSSTGNLSGLKEVPLEASNGLRVYAEPARDNTEERSGQLVSLKTFQISLVPTIPGVISIPEIALDYFDPHLGRYQAASVKGLRLVVQGKPLVQPPIIVPQTSQEASSSNTEPAPPETEDGQYPKEGFFTLLNQRTPWETVALFAVVLVVLAVWVWVLMNFRSEERRSIEELERALRTSLSRIAQVPESASYEALRAAVRRVLSAPELVVEVLQVLDVLENWDKSPHETLRHELVEVLRKLRSL